MGVGWGEKLSNPAQDTARSPLSRTLDLLYPARRCPCMPHLPTAHGTEPAFCSSCHVSLSFISPTQLFITSESRCHLRTPQEPAWWRGPLIPALGGRQREAEGGRSLNSMLAWSTERVLGQPGLHREAPSWEEKRKKNAAARDGLSLHICLMPLLNFAQTPNIGHF